MSRILIFAEAVTLAHVGRPIALSRILRELGHDVCIAAAPAADRWLDAEGVARQQIDSIASTAFLRALGRGSPPYDTRTLKRYVEDDLRAIAAWTPDIVIGDFRLSLYISARLAGKPYGAIANAYWSRRYWTGVDAPEVAPLNWLPRRFADAIFRAVYPAAFAWHALPFSRTCTWYGIDSPGPDIRDVYTASDATAFADVEAFYEPTLGAPDTPIFIGPLAWEPLGAEPLPEFPDGPPIVFVSLGSSGSGRRLGRTLDAIANLPVRCLVATGAGGSAQAVPANCLHVAEFLPYSQACGLASVVICNGGAPAVYAALAVRRPIVAIPTNLDQILNARAIMRLDAGLAVRAVSVQCVSIANALRDLIAGSATMASGRPLRIAPNAAEAVTSAARWIERLRPLPARLPAAPAVAGRQQF